MNRINKDKILTVFATGILGYYISISVLRGIAWKFLSSMLPAMNNRHLPQIYIGLLGAAMGIALGYLIFLKFIEKKDFSSGKRQYLAALVLMIIAPFVVAGIFRSHAVGFVEKAEHTIPTSIRITEGSEDANIMFEQGKDVASGLSKQLVPKEKEFEDWGRWIAELQLEKTIDMEKYENKDVAIIWLDYDVDGKWYSKIMRFDGEFFTEDVGNGKMGIYKNSKLANAVKNIMETAKDIGQYKKATIVNVDTHQNRDKHIEISEADFQEMIRSINKENQIEPDAKTLNRFKSLIPKTEKNIYGIYLYGETVGINTTENFMAYDKQTDVLKFEGKYYNGDFIKKYIP